VTGPTSFSLNSSDGTSSGAYTGGGIWSIASIDFYGGFNGRSVAGYDSTRWLVQPGDYFSFNASSGAPQIFRVDSLVDPTNDPVQSDPGIGGSPITAASMASPIQISTLAAHGLTTGAQVLITGAQGNTAANGLWTITVVGPNDFNLNGSTGNAAYTGGAIWNTGQPISNTAGWVVIRGPRVREGTAPLALPDNVALDLTTNATYGASPQPTSGQNLDIMFSPSGSVISLGMTDKVQLWLRDTSLDPTASPLDPTATYLGDQILITIYARSGDITAQPIDPTLGTTLPQRYANPYAFTQDGRGSGL
jgi:hypothetical protein